MPRKTRASTRQTGDASAPSGGSGRATRTRSAPIEQAASALSETKEGTGRTTRKRTRGDSESNVAETVPPSKRQTRGDDKPTEAAAQLSRRPARGEIKEATSARRSGRSEHKVVEEETVAAAPKRTAPKRKAAPVQETKTSKRATRAKRGGNQVMHIEEPEEDEEIMGTEEPDAEEKADEERPPTSKKSKPQRKTRKPTYVYEEVPEETEELPEPQAEEMGTGRRARASKQVAKEAIAITVPAREPRSRRGAAETAPTRTSSRTKGRQKNVEQEEEQFKEEESAAPAPEPVEKDDVCTHEERETTKQDKDHKNVFEADIDVVNKTSVKPPLEATGGTDGLSATTRKDEEEIKELASLTTIGGSAKSGNVDERPEVTPGKVESVRRTDKTTAPESTTPEVSLTISQPSEPIPKTTQLSPRKDPQSPAIAPRSDLPHSVSGTPTPKALPITETQRATPTLLRTPAETPTPLTTVHLPASQTLAPTSNMPQAAAQTPKFPPSAQTPKVPLSAETVKASPSTQALKVPPLTQTPKVQPSTQIPTVPSTAHATNIPQMATQTPHARLTTQTPTPTMKVPVAATQVPRPTSQTLVPTVKATQAAQSTHVPVSGPRMPVSTPNVPQAAPQTPQAPHPCSQTPIPKAPSRGPPPTCDIPVPTPKVYQAPQTTKVSPEASQTIPQTPSALPTPQTPASSKIPVPTHVSKTPAHASKVPAMASQAPAPTSGVAEKPPQTPKADTSYQALGSAPETPSVAQGLSHSPKLPPLTSEISAAAPKVSESLLPTTGETQKTFQPAETTKVPVPLASDTTTLMSKGSMIAGPKTSETPKVAFSTHSPAPTTRISGAEYHVPKTPQAPVVVAPTTKTLERTPQAPMQAAKGPMFASQAPTIPIAGSHTLTSNPKLPGSAMSTTEALQGMTPKIPSTGLQTTQSHKLPSTGSEVVSIGTVATATSEAHVAVSTTCEATLLTPKVASGTPRPLKMDTAPARSTPVKGETIASPQQLAGTVSQVSTPRTVPDVSKQTDALKTHQTPAGVPRMPQLIATTPQQPGQTPTTTRENITAKNLASTPNVSAFQTTTHMPNMPVLTSKDPVSHSQQIHGETRIGLVSETPVQLAASGTTNTPHDTLKTPVPTHNSDVAVSQTASGQAVDKVVSGGPRVVAHDMSGLTPAVHGTQLTSERKTHVLDSGSALGTPAGPDLTHSPQGLGLTPARSRDAVMGETPRGLGLTPSPDQALKYSQTPRGGLPPFHSGLLLDTPTPANTQSSDVGEWEYITKEEVEEVRRLSVEQPGLIGLSEDSRQTEGTFQTTGKPSCDGINGAEKIQRRFLLNPHELSIPSIEKQVRVISYAIPSCCPTEAQSIFDEIHSHDADIVCVQTVALFRSSVEVKLKNLGYSVVAMDTDPICTSTLYKTTKFQLLDKKMTTLSLVAEQSVDSSSNSPDVKEAIKQSLPPSRSQLLLVKLKSIASDQLLVVGNVHFDGQSRIEISTFQAVSAVNLLLNFIGPVTSPYILCGDFGIQPSSPAYDLLKDGYMNTELIEKLQAEKTVTMPAEKGEKESEREKSPLLNLLWNSFQHSATNMKSSYQTVLEEEPKLTSINRQTNKTSTVDYIWYNKDALRLHGILNTTEFKEPTPSCHQPLRAQLSFL